MAKLSHISAWMAKMLDDEPRARSLKMISRKEGMFPASGRGRGSADMLPKDGATAIWLTLYNDAPTKCASIVREIASLPLREVDIFPNGPREDDRITLSGDALQSTNIPLPSQYRTLPTTAQVALTDILAAPKWPYWLDTVSIGKDHFGPFVEILTYDLDAERNSSLESERDFFQFKATFGQPLSQQHEGKHWQAWLSGEELFSLYCLIHNIDAEEVE